MATHSVFLPGESHGQRSLVSSVQGITERWTQLSTWAHKEEKQGGHESTGPGPADSAFLEGSIPTSGSNEE